MTRPTILFLPGLLCDEALFAPQIADLSDVADALVADLTKDDSVAAMAQRALATVPGPFALVGLSMGGYVAFEVMRQAPERVERIALLDTSAKPDKEDSKARRRALMNLASRGRFKGVTPKLLPKLVAPDHRTGPIADTVFAMAERVGKDAFLRQQTAIMNRPDSRPDLSGYRIPALVGVGALDEITPPAEADEMAGLIPNARLVTFEGAGHLAPLESPKAVSGALRGWLTT